MDLRLLVAALAVWRVSSLIVREAGPWGVFSWLRTAANRWQSTTDLVSCVWCVSVWIGIPATVLALTDGWVVLLPLALSAIAIGMDKVLYVPVRN